MIFSLVLDDLHNQTNSIQQNDAAAADAIISSVKAHKRVVKASTPVGELTRPRYVVICMWTENGNIFEIADALMSFE